MKSNEPGSSGTDVPSTPQPNDGLLSAAGFSAENREAFVMELVLRQYDHQRGEILFQIGRRDSAIRSVFALLGAAMTGTLALLAIGEQLLALCGAVVIWALVPLLLYAIFAHREHADERVGEINQWMMLWYDPAMPAGVGWDTNRRNLASGNRPSGPRPDLRRSARLIVAVIDALALAASGGALSATVAVGHWWSWWFGVAGLILLAAAAYAMVQTLRLVQHARDVPPDAPTAAG